MSAEHRAVCHDHMVADLAVVPDVAAGHEVAVVADGCNGTIFDRAAINRHTLTENVVIANPDAGWLIAVANVLWFTANDGARMDKIVSTNMNVSANDDVCDQSRAGFNFDVWSDDAVGANLN